MPQKQHHETILDLLTEKDEVTWQSMIYDLVRTEQMDPWDIDVSKLTKVYIETLKKLQQINFRITGKVVLAAALLLKIKSSRLVGRDIEETLFASLILEDDSRKAMQAAVLGDWDYFSPEECREFDAEINLQRRAHRAWDYLVKLESRWDKQPATGLGPLA